MYKVTLTQIIEKMELKNLLPDIDTDSINVNQSGVNRIALQLAGFFEHFDSERIQVIGKVEYAYLEQFDEKHMIPIYEKIFESKIPCIIFCRGLEPSDAMLDIAERAGVPILITSMTTSDFIASAVRWLSEQLAPAHLHPRRAGGCVRGGRPDHGRERYRKERGGSGADPPGTSPGVR